MAPNEVLLACLRDEALVGSLLDSEGTDEARDSLKQILATRMATLESDRMVIAVLGIQGAGKSSLLNALVTGVDLLPVEADETTCIPVELSSAAAGDSAARVVFKNGESRQVAPTRESLEQYVNNVYNPGNQLGVDHLEVSLPSPLLDAGTVFVDLPGVESLTPENQETTLRYIRTCTGGIFVLRLVPPITGIEARFLRATWPLMSQVLFVQNWWTGETDRERQEGERHNEAVLRQVAAQARVSAPPELFTVQVKNAVRAAFSGDAQLDERSGLARLREQVAVLRQNWQEAVRRDTAMLLLTLTRGAERRFRVIEADLAKSVEQAEADVRAEQTRSNEELQNVWDQFESLRRKVRTRHTELDQHLSKFIASHRDRAIGQVTQTIESGVVDGPLLSRAASERTADAEELVLEELQFQVSTLVEETMKEFSHLVQRVTKWDLEFTGVDRPDSFKAEKALPAGVGLAGGALGPAALALIVTNPAGWAVGAAIVVGSLVGMFVGSRGRRAVEKRRQAAARSEALGAVHDYFGKLGPAVRDQVQNSITQMLRGLDDMLETESARTRNSFRERLGTLRESRSDREDARRRNQERLDRAARWIEQLTEIAAG